MTHGKQPFAIMCLTLLATPSQAEPTTVIEPLPTTEGAPRGAALLLLRAMLDGHNAARAAVGTQPLVWNDALAADAAGQARMLAGSDRFQHGDGLDGAHPEGENLFMGTRGAYPFASMLASWVGEKRLYRAGTMPNISSTGDWSDAGHYSQVIWRNTTRIGCAVASNASEDILVCRYTAPGNVEGERAN